MPIFAIAVFLSSFLLFAVQPMIAKFLLPSFGGAAAVWATCLVVFQTLLLAGYAYAHLLRAKLSPTTQRWVHLALLAAALGFLPPVPHLVSAHSVDRPMLELLRGLFTSIGVPFFALSATAPLLMEWFRQSVTGRSPDRLYAFSNAGSLLALLCYPFVLEPIFSRHALAWLWSGGMGGFLLICATVAWQSRRTSSVAGTTTNQAVSSLPPPGSANQGGSFDWFWVLLPACGSALLMALTNQISQDVAPMPLLWIAPLGVYLLTFILCFESQRTYRRWLFVPAGYLAFLVLAWLLQDGYLHGFWLQIGGYLGVLFCACMVCHGELYRLRPPAAWLTTYYLAISLGGALGGVFVALIAPILFDSLVETPLIAFTLAGACAFMLWRERFGPGDKAQRPTVVAILGGMPAWQLALAGTVVVAGCQGYVLREQRRESIHFTRSFYGAYRVKEGPKLLMDRINYPLTPGPARVLLSGQIYHGLQFIEPEAAKIATTYYSDQGGLGFVFRELPVPTNRNIGAIGLGTGTLAAYGQPGDHIRFYEINPDVVRIAQTHFTFLTNCPAILSIGLGDGRLSLKREPPQNFDLLVLDAFAGDSIPMHLLTEEAMSSYMRHLKPGGVMAFHISNSHLDLEPIVRALATQHDLTSVLVPANPTDVRTGKLPSLWMLLSANENFLRRPEVLKLTSLNSRSERRASLLWTDDHSTILPILH